MTEISFTEIFCIDIKIRCDPINKIIFPKDNEPLRSMFQRNLIHFTLKFLKVR